MGRTLWESAFPVGFLNIRILQNSRVWELPRGWKPFEWVVPKLVDICWGFGAAWPQMMPLRFTKKGMCYMFSSCLLSVFLEWCIHIFPLVSVASFSYLAAWLIPLFSSLMVKSVGSRAAQPEGGQGLADCLLLWLGVSFVLFFFLLLLFLSFWCSSFSSSYSSSCSSFSSFCSSSSSYSSYCFSSFCFSWCSCCCPSSSTSSSFFLLLL